MSDPTQPPPAHDLERRVRRLTHLQWANTALIVTLIVLVLWTVNVTTSTQHAVEDFLTDMRGAFLPR